MSDINIKEKEEVVEEPSLGDPKPYYEEIEEQRKALYKSYATSRRISNILMFVMVAAIAGVMFMIISNNNILRIVGYVVAGLLLAGMIIYYVLNRKKLPNKVKDYVAFVSATLNKEMFSAQGFGEIESNPDDRLQMDDLIGDGVYVEATGINSRNIVKGTYKGHHFTYSEAALLRPSSRKQQVPPLFVGRYISMPNQMKFDGRFIFNFRNPKQPLDVPNAITDLSVLEEKDEFIVYGPENTNYHDVINNKILSQLKKIEIQDHLLNVNVVFWGGHTAVYLSYDDPILSVPFEKQFDHVAFEQSLKDLMICFDAISEE